MGVKQVTVLLCGIEIRFAQRLENPKRFICGEHFGTQSSDLSLQHLIQMFE